MKAQTLHSMTPGRLRHINMDVLADWGIGFVSAPAAPQGDGCVYIQTNHRQLLGALVSAYSLRKHSRHGDAFDVRIMLQSDFAFFAEYEGRGFLRKGKTRIWRNDDLQSFTPTRFLAPQLQGYQGRAVVIDPDIFALGDIHELLARDMQGKAIICQQRPGKPGWDSSVMLLDCARLEHWKVEQDFDALFKRERDYFQWMSLQYEDPDSIDLFEREWNSLDHLDENTKLLHNTRRRAQPWKTGLPIEFTPGDKHPPIVAPVIRLVQRAMKRTRLVGHYRPHADPRQEAVFFRLLAGCLEAGVVTTALCVAEMAAGHLRVDALDLVPASRSYV